MPHAVARVGRIGVRLVLAPGETALREVREHLAARDREQRAQQVAAREPHAGETGRTAAAQQPQQQRLGLVVPGVRDGDRHGALVVLDPAQEGVALAARRLLEAALLGARALADAAAPGAQRHAERGAQLVAEGGVVGGAGPQAVVEVRGDELEAAAAAQRRERVQRAPRSRRRRRGRRRSVSPRAGRPAASRARSTAATRNGILMRSGPPEVRIGGGAGIRTPDAADMSRVL